MRYRMVSGMQRVSAIVQDSIVRLVGFTSQLRWMHRKLYQMCQQIPQLEHFRLRCQEDTDDTGSYCHQSQSQHRSLNVLPGASPDSTDNPHYQRFDCHYECYLNEWIVVALVDDNVGHESDSSIGAFIHV
ncbi:hypothetical protein Tco_1089990 [Tanacetum coccineum]|uniref:Uncharacterized protein n=1 Tax=Tanacetum coccineum TaxID=301880 RepID=A0ABQ5I2W7_9ASTR